jgi:hypothetical protein
MADEGRNQAAYIAALTEELRSVELASKPDRAAAVKAELARLGAGGQPPAQRAQKRAAKPDPDES